MGTYIIYTTQGSTLAPNVDVEVDNCQVLGWTECNDETDAINRVFNDNPWIEEAGFTKANCTALRILPSNQGSRT